MQLFRQSGLIFFGIPVDNRAQDKEQFCLSRLVERWYFFFGAKESR